MTDNVNQPMHYTSHPSGVECIRVTEHMGFNLGNAIKYIWRCDLKKDDVVDLKKARWYLDREIQRREKQLSTQPQLGGVPTIALPVDQVAQTHVTQPKIGEYLAGQGGIYVGNILGDDGTTYGLIASKDSDIGKSKWGGDGELSLSNWDGLTNANKLRDDYPAAKLASSYEADGHVDFYLPARRELLIAAANAPHLFNKESFYWTSSTHGEYGAWAVVFESGSVRYFCRSTEFRVRPFRRFAL